MNRLLYALIAVGFVIWLVDPAGQPASVPAATLPSTFREPGEAGDLKIVRRVERHRDKLAGGTAFTGGNAVVLQRGENGHFFVDAQVNGMPVRFLVDTGASTVALTTADAQRVGLQFARGEFDRVGAGASGPVNGKFVMLGSVTVQGKSATNVEGVIIEGGEMSLLGQSFLRRMGRIEIAGDQMIIR